jgi:DNA end-binding protein Ku
MPSNARAIASLTISFGLVAIPVKLYSATQSTGQISFNMLHKDCGSRLKQQYVCLKEGVVVERDDIVKGYEFAKDQYVAFTPEEIKALDEVGTHAVEISEFVPIESIDPVYFDKTYYLSPDKGASKPYALLTEALKETKRCAVGRWISRGKEHIVILRPMDDGLAMHQLHFKAEVRSIKDLGVEAAPVSDAELKLANQLIEQLAAKRFDPNEYVDEHRARVEAAIQRKVEGKEVSFAEAPAETGATNVVDLMAVLKASLDARGSKDAKERKAPKKAPVPGEAASARKSRR